MMMMMMKGHPSRICFSFVSCVYYRQMRCNHMTHIHYLLYVSRIFKEGLTCPNPPLIKAQCRAGGSSHSSCSSCSRSETLLQGSQRFTRLGEFVRQFVRHCQTVLISGFNRSLLLFGHFT